MTSGARRISDTLLELYLADALDTQTRARCEALLSESPVDQTRLKELRVEAAVSLAQHSTATVVARFQQEREHSFTVEERARLQSLASEMNTQVHEKEPVTEGTGGKPSLLETFFLPEAIVFDSPGTEVSRTMRATELLERWFGPAELGPNGLPVVLLERLEQLMRSPKQVGHALSTWVRRGPGRRLKITFRPLPEEDGHKPWALLFDEEVEKATVPREWSEVLTVREREVVAHLLHGWDNMTIAEQLGASVNTVKAHVRRIFDKLGVDSRAALSKAVSSSGRSGLQAGKGPPGGQGGKSVKSG